MCVEGNVHEYVDELLIRALMLYHNLCRNCIYRGPCSYRVVLVCVSIYNHITDRVVNTWWGNVSRHGM